MKIVAIFAAVLAVASAAPTMEKLDLPSAEEVKEAAAGAAADFGNLVKAKTDVLGLAGEAVGEAFVAAGNATVDFLADFDAVEALDKAEAAITASKTAQIEAVFDAKRALVTKFRGQRPAIEALLNSTVEGINSAIIRVTDRLSATKERISDYTGEISLENAKLAISGALNTTSAVIEATGAAIIAALVGTKESINEAVVNFDSQAAISGTKEAIGDTFEATADKVGDAAENLGIFSAIDGLVQGVAEVPNKINNVIKDKLSRGEEEEEVMEDEEDEATTEVVEAREEEEEEDVMEGRELLPLVDVQVTVKGDVSVDEGLEAEITSAVAKRVENSDTTIVVELISRAAARAEDESIEVAVNVDSNVEITDGAALEDDIVSAVRSRVKALGAGDEEPDMTVRVEIDEDILVDEDEDTEDMEDESTDDDMEEDEGAFRGSRSQEAEVKLAAAEPKPAVKAGATAAVVPAGGAVAEEGAEDAEDSETH